MESKGSLPYHKILLLCPSLRLMNPVQHVTYYFLKIHLNITLLSMPRSFKQYIYIYFFQFSLPKLGMCFLYAPYMLHTPPVSPFIWYRYTHHEVLHYAVLSVLLLLLPCRPSIFPSTLFSDTLKLCFSPNLRDQDPHPYNGKSYSSVHCNCYVLRWENRRT